MSRFEIGAHVFVDESKAKGYSVSAAAVSQNDVGKIDRDLR